MTIAHYFPFYPLGYRCNPFGALTREEWRAIALVSPASIEALGGTTHLQILGEKGHGKTTTLMGLEEHFQEKGVTATYIYIPLESRLPRIDWYGPSVLLLDEAQRLTLRARTQMVRALRQRGTGLRVILGSHKDYLPLFTRHGLPLATIEYTTSSPETVAAIIARKLAYFALPEVAGVTIAPDAIALLWETYQGDIRALEACLYEVFQTITQCETITAAHIRHHLLQHP